MNSSRMILKQKIMGPMMNFIYLIGCSETKEAAVVDPAWDTPSILALAEESQLQIRHILMTHAHPDHMNGLEQMLKDTGAMIYLHRDEVAYMKECGDATGIPTAFMHDRSGNFRIVEDGDTLKIGSLSVQCLHTPGHTPGSQCFLVEGNLFTGDTLFVDACGRVDMPGGDAQKMWHSLNRKLRALDDSIVIYPGHNYGSRKTSTMGEQKETNPYMSFTSAQEFGRAMGM
ncbi:MAG: MBL fold metallo-hydrolase [Acidobacteria bacterium]|nr:MBL fold metallo-hydrolase [Acidobacteriota bacterium]